MLVPRVQCVPGLSQILGNWDTCGRGDFGGIPPKRPMLSKIWDAPCVPAHKGLDYVFCKVLNLEQDCRRRQQGLSGSGNS